MCFVVTNIAYYVILPWESLRASNAIAVVCQIPHMFSSGSEVRCNTKRVQAVGKKALGEVGGLIFAILVSMSCLGSLNINVYITSRLTVSSASRGYLPLFLEGEATRGSRERGPRQRLSNGFPMRDQRLRGTPV